MSEFRYKAFISYSHQDRAWAAWLQRALESYRVPRRLRGSPGACGPVPARIAPVFRDREDLSSAADLSASVRGALNASETLLVVCSPAAVASGWVGREIEHFQALGRPDRIFALIVDGDPQAADPAQRCFPESLSVAPDGTLREPLAADARKWADGRQLARLKLIAGILGIRLDDLRRRDLQRRQRTWVAAMAAVATIAVVMAVLAVVAINARSAAENRREHAEELVGYMVGDLRAKLGEVGRLDILEGMGGRVSEYLATLDPGEVTDESLIQQAKVWRQLGEVSMDQGDLAAALEAFRTSRDVVGELHRRNPDEPQFVFELGNAEFWVGYVHLERGEFDRAETALTDYLAWAYRLNELAPGNPDWLLEKSYAHGNLAALANRKRVADVDAALLHIEQAVAINREVLELAPDDTRYLSEYGEAIAWLADTQLLVCDLGGALRSRQEQVDIARRLSDAAGGNANLKTRYAYSLTGLANVARMVGLVDAAVGYLTDSGGILGQLSILDPSNLNLRFDYLLRERDVAELLGETGRLDEALQRVEAVGAAMREAVASEDFANQRRHVSWVNFLLTRSELSWRSGDLEAAAAHLDQALAELEHSLEQADALDGFMLDNLLDARFLAWQQRGEDVFDRAVFAGLSTPAGESRSCAASASRIRQAILSDDLQSAADLTRELLARGYYDPAFIRTCRQYGLCQGGG